MLTQIISQITNNPLLGLLIIKKGIGALYLIFGIKKAMGDTKTLLFLGSQMKIFGITTFPEFWGVCAIVSEFTGGLSLITNYGIAYIIPFTMITMLVAIAMHIHNGDDFLVYSYPLSLLIVLIGIYVGR